MPRRPSHDERLRVAVANDYELVVAGLAALLEPHDERIEVADAIQVGEPVSRPVDVALYDTFGREGLVEDQLSVLLATPGVERVAVYTASESDDLLSAALAAGAAGVISKRLSSNELVAALERVAEVAPLAGPAPGSGPPAQRPWPGRELGLTERESETVVLASQGLTNKEIADALFVSVDTVKSHLQRSFRKLGTTNRAQLAHRVLRDPAFRLHARSALRS